MISQAVTSLKNNKNLRKKHRKKTEGLSGDKSMKTELVLPKSSKIKMKRLKLKLQKERRQARIKQLIVLGLVVIILISTFIFLA